jgi:hypothetical protein
MFINNVVLWTLNLFNIYAAVEMIDKLVTPASIKLYTNPNKYQQDETNTPIYRQKRTFTEKSPTYTGVPDGI